MAIIKAQFEILHPFLDGNGRIGRMLVPLFLYEKKAMSSPMFYMSAYLESNRDEYYSRLQSISKAGDGNGWIDFFLRAIEEQADTNIRKTKQILSLYDELNRFRLSARFSIAHFFESTILPRNRKFPRIAPAG